MIIRDLKVLGIFPSHDRLIISKLGLSIFSYTLYSVSMHASAMGYTYILSTENGIIFSIITDYLLSFVIYTKGVFNHCPMLTLGNECAYSN